MRRMIKLGKKKFSFNMQKGEQKYKIWECMWNFRDKLWVDLKEKVSE